MLSRHRAWRSLAIGFLSMTSLDDTAASRHRLPPESDVTDSRQECGFLSTDAGVVFVSGLQDPAWVRCVFPALLPLACLSPRLDHGQRHPGVCCCTRTRIHTHTHTRTHYRVPAAMSVIRVHQYPRRIIHLLVIGFLLGEKKQRPGPTEPLAVWASGREARFPLQLGSADSFVFSP